jgi:outer membrane receptor protein involved in Fe transport
MKHTYLSWGAAAIAALGTSVTFAQQTQPLEEVIVTGVRASIESYNQSGAQPPAVVVKDAAQMDFSLDYDINENWTVSFDATNLLDRPIYNYFGSGSSNRDAFLFPRDVRSNDRTFSVGMRMRL